MRIEKLPYERIRNLRVDAGLSQKQVWAFLHVSQNTYSQYEIGTIRLPVEILVKLAKFYHTSTDYLLELTDVRTPYPPKVEDPAP